MRYGVVSKTQSCNISAIGIHINVVIIAIHLDLDIAKHKDRVQSLFHASSPTSVLLTVSVLWPPTVAHFTGVVTNNHFGFR